MSMPLFNDLASDRKKANVSHKLSYQSGEASTDAVSNCKINLSFETRRARDRMGAISNPLESIFFERSPRIARNARVTYPRPSVSLISPVITIRTRRTRQRNKLFTMNTNDSTQITRDPTNRRERSKPRQTSIGRNRYGLRLCLFPYFSSSSFRLILASVEETRTFFETEFRLAHALLFQKNM